MSNGNYILKTTFLLFVITMLTILCCEDNTRSKNHKPTCKIISPLNNSEVKQNKSLLIEVEADDEDGEIVNTNFSIDNSIIYETDTLPYIYNWNLDDISVGVHIINVTVTDDDANSCSDQITIKVLEGNHIPNAKFVISPNQGTTDTLFEFDATTTVDAEDDTSKLLFRWDFEGDDNWDTEFCKEKIIRHQYETGSIYFPKLEVVDSESDTGSYTKRLKVIEIEKGTVSDIDGNTYRTIKIGIQWWMAENLKVKHFQNGEKIPYAREGNSSAYCVYGDNEENAQTFGNLYNWYAVSDSRKLAPKGWHVATDNDWKILERYIGMGPGVANGAGPRGGSIGDKLKSTYGWVDDKNGTDDYGFCVLPGGLCDYWFELKGREAYFWTLTPSNSETRAIFRKFFPLPTGISREAFPRNEFYSVRCIKTSENDLNNSPYASFSISPEGGNVQTEFQFDASASSDIEDTQLQYRWDWENDGTWDTEFSPNPLDSHKFDTNGEFVVRLAVKDTREAIGTTTKKVVVIITSSFVDRDGNLYKTVKIGDQWWMAENLRLKHYQNGDEIPNIENDTEWANLQTGAWCSNENKDENEEKYGPLYNWYVIGDSREIAPEGWGIPTEDDYMELSQFIGAYAGEKLKSKTGWVNGENGTDVFEFNALPGGSRYYSGDFSRAGGNVAYWTSTLRDDENAKTVSIIWSRENESWGFEKFNSGAYIRCIKYDTNPSNYPPTAYFSFTPESGTVSTIFTFDASSTSDIEDNNSQLKVRWDWESDGNWDTEYTTLKLQHHKFDHDGTYLVKMEVLDSDGATATFSRDVLVDESLNFPPVANFEVSPSSGFLETIFTFDASGSSDGEDEDADLNVRWDWENDGIWDTEYSTNKIATHQYQCDGKYSVKLEVIDRNEKTDEIIKEVVVVESGTVTDIEGNVYKTVKIGDQWWMAENLRTTHFQNEDELPNVSNDEDWEELENTQTSAYCIFDDDIESKGVLYNWYTVNDSRDITPNGWHIPSDEEWKQLEIYLGMSILSVNEIGDRGQDEGEKLKSSQGWDSNGNGINEYNFNALPTGYRTSIGTLSGQYITAMYWTSTFMDNNAYIRKLSSSNKKIKRINIYKNTGCIIRCVKDNETPVNTNPSASFKVIPEIGIKAKEFNFDASKCLDIETDNEDLQVRWDWENDGIWDTGYTKEKQASHKYDSPGEYQINLEVIDAGGLKDNIITTVKVLDCGTVTDIDGNIYYTVQIGNQIWMAENLKVRHYRNGDIIPNVPDSTEWSNLKNGAYCCYNNDETNSEKYGLLYNFHTILDTRSLAPEGWHIPTRQEYDELSDFIGDQGAEKLKAYFGWLENRNGTDEFGFSALPAGIRYGDGRFYAIGFQTVFSTASEYDPFVPYTYSIYYLYNSFNDGTGSPIDGYSIRCIKDN